jgi:hypothetical protein
LLARLQSISQFLGNKTVAATRLYWSRHRERLGLDGIMSERAAAGLGAEEPSPNAGPAAAAVAAIAGLPNLQAWAPLLDQLQRQQQEQQHQAALALVASTPVPGVTSPGAAAAQSAAQTPAATPAPVRPTALEAALAPSPGGVIAAAAIAAVLRAEQEAAAAADNMEVDTAAPAALGGAAPGQQQGQLQGQGSGAEVLNAAVSSAAASLLPKDELDKLQTLLEPGTCCAYLSLQIRAVCSAWQTGS